MKKIFYTLLASLILVSCSLKEVPVSQSTTDTFYKSIEQCETGIYACYNQIRSMLSGTGFWMATECTTDLMYLLSSTQYNATLDISPTKPAIASTIWKYCYQSIMRCNSLLAALERGVEEKNFKYEEALPLKGEIIVLRSFYYYLLTSAFGDVPYYTDVVTQDNRAQIASLPRMNANETRDKIIATIQEVLYPAALGGEEALPLQRAFEKGDNGGRASAAMGLMIAAKFCLWNERWNDAIEILGILEDIYGHYDSAPASFARDYPLSDVRFREKFVKESIFEIVNTFEEYGLQYTGGLAPFTTPSQSVSAFEEDDDNTEYKRTDVFNGIAIPELGAYSRVNTSARPTTYFYMTVLPYYSDDARAGEYSNDVTAPRGGCGALAWRWSGYDKDDKIRDPETRSIRWFSSCTKANSRPWLGDKFWCPNMYYTQDSNNYKIFRFADALLMLAEAHLRAGNMEKASAYLNITRTRAGLGSISPQNVGNNPEALMEEIRLERARELVGEYQRKFDLVRWGIWYERTKAYNDGSYLQGFIRPYHRYLPIPAEQITYSGGALDNKEYEE